MNFRWAVRPFTPVLAFLGLLVLPLPHAILHFLLLRHQRFGRRRLRQSYFRPSNSRRCQGDNEAGRERGGYNALQHGRPPPPLSSYRSRVERHAGTPNTIGPTKISYPPARASTGPVDRAIESSVGRGLAEGT